MASQFLERGCIDWAGCIWLVCNVDALYGLLHMTNARLDAAISKAKGARMPMTAILALCNQSARGFCVRCRWAVGVGRQREPQSGQTGTAIKIRRTERVEFLRRAIAAMKKTRAVAPVHKPTGI